MSSEVLSVVVSWVLAIFYLCVLVYILVYGRKFKYRPMYKISTNGTKCTSYEEESVQHMKSRRYSKKVVRCDHCVHLIGPNRSTSIPLCGQEARVVNGVIREIVDVKGLKLCVLKNKRNDCRYFTRFDIHAILFRHKVLNYLDTIMQSGGDDGRFEGYSLEKEREQVREARRPRRPGQSKGISKDEEGSTSAVSSESESRAEANPSEEDGECFDGTEVEGECASESS